MNKNKQCEMISITELLDTIVDNRGKSCPTQESGFPLIATNCIKHSSIYPTFENVRYVSNETLEGWFRAELRPNDILFVNKGTPGRVCLVPDPITFCAAQDMIGLRVNSNKVYYKYLFAVLRSDFIQKKIMNFHVGIAIPHFKKSDMDNLLIPIPDMDVQIAIGDMYCSVSEKIENNNRINAELESMAKTIYDYWFLQFEFPNEEGKPYKSSGGKMVWNEELKREIPEGWEVKHLEEVAQYHNGYAFYKDGYDREGAKVVDLGNVNLLGLYIDTKDDKYISLDRYNDEKYSGYRLKKNDLIMIMTDRKATMDLLGKTGKIYKDSKYLLNQRVARIRSNNDFNVNYLYATLNGTFTNNMIKGRALGSVQKYINSGDIITLPILYPYKETMKSFGEMVNDMYSKMDSNLQEIEELTSLRDFLLPMLMNGQVGFKE